MYKHKTISVEVDFDVDVDVDDVLNGLDEKDFAELGYVPGTKKDAGPVRAHVDAMRLAALRADHRAFMREAEAIADAVGVIMDTSPLLREAATA